MASGSDILTPPGPLFTYGTLCAADVWREVAGADSPRAAATVADWAAYGVAGQVYPGLVHEPGATTEGVVYDGVESPTLERLDRFEGSMYRRRVLRVTLADGAPIDAWAYVVGEAHRMRLTNRRWSLREFLDGSDPESFRHRFPGFGRVGGKL